MLKRIKLFFKNLFYIKRRIHKSSYIPHRPDNLPKRIIDKDGNLGDVQVKSNDGKDYLVFYDASSPIKKKFPTVKAWWVKINQVTIIQ